MRAGLAIKIAASKRGRPATVHALTAWGKPAKYLRQGELTKFEELILALGLEEAGPEIWAIDPKVRRFARKNRNQRYIPEEVLELMKLDVSVTL